MDDSKPRKKSLRTATKKKALSLYASGQFSKSEISEKLDVPYSTLKGWIDKTTNEIKRLEPKQRIKIWQSESLKDMQLAGIARDSLIEDFSDPIKASEIKLDTKRAIAHSLSVAAGIKWDKVRLEEGKSTDNVTLDSMLLSVHRHLFDKEAHSDPVAVEPVDIIDGQEVIEG